MKWLFIFALGMLISCSRQSLLPTGFVYLDEFIPGVVTEPRYFSSNNFVGDTIDGYKAPRVICTKEAAVALRQVQQDLSRHGFGLKIFDAYRPQQGVDHFVRWGKDLSDTLMKAQYYPEEPKDSLFVRGYIATRSGHSRGSTIDLTLIHLGDENKGEELDMGTPWDYFGARSWPSSDAVSAEQKGNRMLLQNVMKKHGFHPLKEEWWHFTLEKEPYPETYFDFPIQ